MARPIDPRREYRRRLPKKSLTAELRARLLKREREEALRDAELDAKCHTFVEGLDFGWQDTEEPEPKPPVRDFLRIACYSRGGNLCDEAAERASEPCKEAKDFTSYL